VNAASALPRHAYTLALAALSTAVALAAVIRALGAAPAARHALGFSFAGKARALDIATTNMRLVAAILFAAYAVRELPRLRLPLDAALVVLLVLNLATLGLALAAYGPRTLQALILHGPVELAAFAIAGAAYLAARQRDLPGRTLLRVIAATGALLVAAAVIEAHVQLGAGW
jgi:hypothetical protein